MMNGSDDKVGIARARIAEVCDEVKTLLLAKNKAYGNSALDPIRLFSKATPAEQLLVRIDDKLSRLARGAATEAVPEDTVLDLIGYLVLYRIAQRAWPEEAKRWYCAPCGKRATDQCRDLHSCVQATEREAAQHGWGQAFEA